MADFFQIEFQNGNEQSSTGGTEHQEAAYEP